MEWQSIFKHFALYGVLISWVFGSWLVWRTRHIDVRTTSELAVTSKKDYFIFATGISLAGIFLALCTYGYMRYNLTVPELYYYLYAFALTMQIITAWVPELPGKKHLIHWYSSWLLAHFMLPLGALLLVEGNYTDRTAQVSGVFQIFGVAILVIMVITETWGLHGEKSNKQVIRAQQVYAVLFQILILARIYV
ncbi:hypothetical protein KC960_00680 [Candidatus Saccharibacteria bacterium]|nr:hypothetical protein [Candidatus Saccharibacteria bacterium]